MSKGTTIRNVRVPEELWNAAKAQAAKDRHRVADVSAAIRWFLQAWIDGEVVPWPVDSNISSR